ncbi:acyl-CoA dehydrogenase family protein [Streptomyces albidoflavus]|uniref:acyl-CoA dehydrogenase family protein n=1 Tax=Streptomyces TaxID=1883 RepID=UPI002148448F|nr:MULTISPECIES: acyl-CoA dehydrogenase family protein [Streptomyces]MCR0989231.1 acyl-CoA/acyl-ACP dehydrogenase [Streptomyces albidoflavus]UYX92405.1 acyl-CoA/acyl-ACP dehydrogenase [Streptomyces sp. BI87]
MTRPPEAVPEPVRAARDLAARWLLPAAAWDRSEGLPREVAGDLARAGLLAPDVPAEYGGAGTGQQELGEVCATLGGVCGAVRGLVTVQGMVAAGLRRWGTAGQRGTWLPRLTSGELVAAFAATEQDAGSALAHVATAVEEDGDELVVSGRKRWVTCGQFADLVLVLGRAPGGPAAVLVETGRPGVSREAVTGQLGMRAARVAHLEFDAVRVPRDHLVAPVGLGLSHVAATVLDHGRHTVAWGCVGMAEAALHDAVTHAGTRFQGGTPLSAHQSVRAVLARSAVAATGARELCRRAARARTHEPGRAVHETVLAKYAAADAAAAVTRDAVQILGSAGCAPDSRAGRLFRDAKVMEIIEGAQHVAETHIADRLFRDHGVPAPRPDGATA